MSRDVSNRAVCCFLFTLESIKSLTLIGIKPTKKEMENSAHAFSSSRPHSVIDMHTIVLIFYVDPASLKTPKKIETT